MGLTNLVRGAANSISHGSPAKPQPQSQSGSTTTTTASSTASSTPAPAVSGSASQSGEDKLMDGAIADDTEVLDDEPKNSQSASSFPSPKSAVSLRHNCVPPGRTLSAGAFHSAVRRRGFPTSRALANARFRITPEVGDR